MIKTDKMWVAIFILRLQVYLAYMGPPYFLGPVLLLEKIDINASSNFGS